MLNFKKNLAPCTKIYPIVNNFSCNAFSRLQVLPLLRVVLRSFINPHKVKLCEKV